jgi:hypothetical protein
MRKLVCRSAWALAALGLAVLALPAAAQLPASPRRFVSNLDVRCYKIPNQPPLNVPLHLDHLNPVFQQLQVPPEDVIVYEPQDLCVPVQKENNVVPSDTLPFIQYVDWKCYGIQGPSIDRPLHIDHLNPVISGMIGPSDDIIVREPQQLCVPVQKDDYVPPPWVQRLIQWLDVKCYRVDPDRKIRLTHLNPLLSGLPPEAANFDATIPKQICVPVAKNGQYPPPDILPFIQWADVLCYNLRGQPLNRYIRLTHLNPVLVAMGLPPEYVYVTDSDKLCVPIAKNGMYPPGPP